MSESAGRSSVSSGSSIPLLEIKNETHLVLKALLHRNLSVSPKERPGRVGGAYRDHNKYSSKPQPKAKDGWDSQAEDVSSADEKKTKSLKGFIKQLPHRNRSTKDPKGSLDRDSKDDASSTSEDEDRETKQEKRVKKNKLRRKISMLFSKKLEEGNSKVGNGSHPKRPFTLPIKKEPDPPSTVVSPGHPPEFYDVVADRLVKIAHKSTSIKKKSPTDPPPPAVCDDKESVVQQLVHVLTLEGDSINTKILSNPFLRNSLARISYASFAKLLDTYSRSQVPEAATEGLPPPASPTLRRMAVSMEVSRQIVTATGARRIQGYAEHYMETFAPWVKSQGGWEKVVDMGESVEYD